jgi:hypothetical protein
VGKPYNVSDKILAEFDWTPLLIESEDGNLIENPRYYELEKILEDNTNPHYKKTLIKTKTEVNFSERLVSSLGVSASAE